MFLMVPLLVATFSCSGTISGQADGAGDAGQNDGGFDGADPSPADQSDAGDGIPDAGDGIPDAGDGVPDAGDTGPVANALWVDGQIGLAACDDYDPDSRACGAGDQVAWQTLAGAASQAGPGDTVIIRAGEYRETLAPQRSGEPGRPVTWRSRVGETVTITGASLEPAIDISSRQHLLIEGLVVTDVRRWMYALDAHHNVIRDNVFRRALDSGGSSKTGLFFQEATFNSLTGNTIEDSTQDNLSLIKSDRNLIQANTFRKAAHTLWTIKCGNYNVIRANHFHNEDQKIGEIYDCDGVGFDHEFTIENATKHNLVEDNDFAYTPSSGDSSPYSGIQYAGQDGLIRRNRFYSTVGPGLQMTLYGGEAEHNTGNRVVHNVFYRTDFAGIELSGSQSYAFGDNLFLNNILARSVFVANDTRWDWYVDDLAGQPVQLKTGRMDGFAFSHNCFFNQQAGELWLIAWGNRDASSNPPPHDVSWFEDNHAELFTDNLEVDPAFSDPAGQDFSLDAGSDLIDAGCFLTLTAADGQGDSLSVLDPGFFYDGYGIPGEVGDRIQLEGQTETAVVTAVDFETGSLRLDRSLTWVQGLGVAYAYNGSRPDVGAHESP
ncbi:MAG: right-handed parallel beta-helix repeat-containing protein [Deltaproteobacteria bacterium]|nr:right-handed parallel beta-helix repeat-containing protein [Deltaproteobacteria bacterium]